jgi:hypothetical protein
MAYTHAMVACTLCVALAGCSSNEHASDGTCNAEQVQSLLGELANNHTVEHAHRLSGARSTRVLSPGDMITLEYDAQRLNIEINEAETIERINCG